MQLIMMLQYYSTGVYTVALPVAKKYDLYLVLEEIFFSGQEIFYIRRIFRK